MFLKCSNFDLFNRLNIEIGIKRGYRALSLMQHSRAGMLGKLFFLSLVVKFRHVCFVRVYISSVCVYCLSKEQSINMSIIYFCSGPAICIECNSSSSNVTNNFFFLFISFFLFLTQLELWKFLCVQLNKIRAVLALTIFRGNYFSLGYGNKSHVRQSCILTSRRALLVSPENMQKMAHNKLVFKWHENIPEFVVSVVQKRVCQNYFFLSL